MLYPAKGMEVCFQEVIVSRADDLIGSAIHLRFVISLADEFFISTRQPLGCGVENPTFFRRNPCPNESSLAFVRKISLCAIVPRNCRSNFDHKSFDGRCY